MERFTQQLRWLLASLMLVAGVSAWAQDPYYTLDTTTDAAKTTSNSYAGTGTATIGGIEWAVNGNGQMYPWRLGGKSISNTDRTVKTNTAMGSAINKVVLTVGTASSITVNSLKLTVASDASFSNVLDEVTATFAASSDITFEPSTGTEWATGAYYKFTFNVTVSQSSNKFVQFSGVKFYAPSASNAVATPTISPNGGTFATSQEVAITCTTSGATIQYSIDGGNNWQNYSSPFTITETTTVQAKATKSGMTDSGTATATFTKAKVYTSLQQLQEDVTSTSQNLTLQMTDIYVTAVKNNNAYISDGTYGALIYTSGHGLTAGQKLNGTLSNAQFVLYRGQTEITNFSSTGLTITEEALPAQVKTIDQITAANQSLLVTLENVTYDGTVLSDGTNSITPYTTFMNDLGLESGKTYNITGIVVVYNSTLEFAPRTADDIVEVGGQVDTRTETYIRFTQGDDEFNYPSGSEFTITVGDDFTSPEAWVTFPNGVYMTKTAASPYLSYSGDNDEVATVNSETGALTFVAGATGTITVTATFTGTTEYKPCEGYYTLKVKPEEVTPTGTGDEITHDFVGVTGTTYTSWSGKEGTSGAVYAGNTAGGNNAVQMRSTNSSGIITTTSGGKVTMVTVEWNDNTSNSRTLDIYGSNEPYDSAADLYNSDSQGTKLGSITKGSGESTQLVITGDYAYIGIRSYSGALWCDKITIYWENSSSSAVATTTTIDATGLTNTDVNAGTDAGTLTATVMAGSTAVSGATVTWESSNTAVATVDADGVVTLVAAGTTTITAKFEGNNEYKPSEASYTITVTDPNAKGTETNPYTVTEAIAYIETLGTSTSPSEVYVSGIISQVDSYNSTYKSITYWISDDGETTTQMEVYSGKGLEGADFSAAEDLQKGDIVTIFGFVKKYSGTPEFDKNNKLVSFERPAVAVEAPVFSVEGGTYTEDQTVTITCATTGASIYYTLDGTEPTTASTPYTAALTISETTTLKAIASDGTNVSTVTTATYTINKVEKPYALNYGTEYYTKVTDLSQLENGDAIIIVNETGKKGVSKALSTTQKNNRPACNFEWMPWIGGSFVQLPANSTVEKFILVKEASESDVSYSFYASRGEADGYIYMACGASNNNYLKTQETKDENAKASITLDENGNATIVFKGSGSRNTLMYNNDADLFSCYGSGQQPVQLYVERPTYVSEANQEVTVADAQDCYKTFITPYDAHFDGVNDHAYIVTLSADQKEAILKEVSVVPAGTPIIYKYETAGTHPITRAISGSDVLEDVSDNVLKVSRGEVKGDGTIFVLNNVSGIGFYRLNEDKTLGMGKCYIKVEQSAGVKFIGINFDGDATGIATVDSEGNVLDGPVFNLAGQRVAVPAHGLYIVNGKKVFIK